MRVKVASVHYVLVTCLMVGIWMFFDGSLFAIYSFLAFLNLFFMVSFLTYLVKPFDHLGKNNGVFTSITLQPCLNG